MVTALKNDLRTPGVGGRKFFDLIAENNKNTSNEIYTSTAPATAETCGSIIKTGYTKNGKPYTHPIYVTIDFQCQVWTLLKDIDKDKLFNYISSPDCSWNADKKKKFKKVFTRVVNLEIEIWNPGNKNEMAGFNNKGCKQEDKETY